MSPPCSQWPPTAHVMVGLQLAVIRVILPACSWEAMATAAFTLSFEHCNEIERKYQRNAKSAVGSPLW